MQIRGWRLKRYWGPQVTWRGHTDMAINDKISIQIGSVTHDSLLIDMLPTTTMAHDHPCRFAQGPHCSHLTSLQEN